MRILYELIESLRIAFAAIRANKARGLLTTLGIIIGIVAVVTTMTAANGLENTFRETFSALGKDVLYISRTPWVDNGDWHQYRNREQLTLRHAEKLEEKLPSAAAINASTATIKSVKYESTTLNDISIAGTTDKLLDVSSLMPEIGRFIIPNDVRYKKRVCVLGAELKERLFGDANALNKKIKVGRHTLRVVGIMERQGAPTFFGGPNFDMRVYVPVTTFVKSFGAANRNFSIAVKAPEGTSVADYEYAVIGEMRKIRQLRPSDKDDFSINGMDTLIDIFNNTMGVIILIGLMITGISLFVGGIGVMNIMFVSVTERTREIGIRKAIGATKRAILSQFLFESAMICVIGGTVGLGVAYGVAALINAAVMPASLSPAIAVVAIVVAILTGIIAGIIPAVKAAKLNPIEALRYE